MRIGLVLSGGLSKGAYQLGFIYSLLKYIDISEIKVISGSSIGFLNAYALSIGKLDYIKELYFSLNCSGKKQLLKKIWTEKYLKMTIEELIRDEEQLRIPLYMSMTAIPIFNARYYKFEHKISQCYKKHVKAAVCYPFLGGFPAIIDGKIAFDGGATDNIPLFPILNDPIIKNTLDLIMVLHFDSHYNRHKYFKNEQTNILDIDVSYDNNFEKRHFDFSQENIYKMFNSGLRYGDKICKFLFLEEQEKLMFEKIKEIEKIEKEKREKSFSIDTLLQFTNFLGRIFRQSNRCIYKTKD